MSLATLTRSTRPTASPRTGTRIAARTDEQGPTAKKAIATPDFSWMTYEWSQARRAAKIALAVSLTSEERALLRLMLRSGRGRSMIKVSRIDLGTTSEGRTFANLGSPEASARLTDGGFIQYRGWAKSSKGMVELTDRGWEAIWGMQYGGMNG